MTFDVNVKRQLNKIKIMVNFINHKINQFYV